MLCRMPTRARFALSIGCVLLACSIAGVRAADAAYPKPQEGTWIARDVKLTSGESMAEVRLHYLTLGTPRRDGSGMVRNAVLILHGTGGDGEQFLQPHFADELFGPGQLLDVTKYFVILPDNIGHGKSSKPSDGLRMKFPHYGYDDMVTLQYRLVSEGLQVNHLHLVMGTSMGGMQSWMWGYRYPDFMDGLMPLASAPVQIAGRNRVWRKMAMDSIREDPAWKNGDYTEEPRLGLAGAVRLIMFVGSVPLYWQTTLAPTRDAADAYLASEMTRRMKLYDANDVLYYLDASRDYDPSPHLEQIVAPLLAINSADDQVNPPELGIVEKLIGRVKHGRFVLIPISPKTRGHSTHTWAAVWHDELAQFLGSLPHQP
jgi:homoserine O-acetyltransferase/O-succinyltransferase